MNRMAPWRRGVVAVGCAMGLVLIVGVSLASASPNVLLMPDRPALRNASIVVWGNTKFPNGSSFVLDFGDGNTQPGNVADRTYIAFTHAYNTVGLKTVKLSVCNGACVDPVATGESETALIDVQDPDPNTQTAQRREIMIKGSIEEGLRSLYRMQNNRASTPTTFWTGSHNTMAHTALVVAALQNHGHFASNDPNKDIYQDVVQRGLNFLFDQLAKTDIGPELHGGPPTFGGDPNTTVTHDPCVNVSKDGSQANTCVGLFATGGIPGYSTSIVALAIAGSNAPARVVAAGLGSQNANFVAGKTYAQVLQRIINTVAWGAADGGQGQGVSCGNTFRRGGYRYGIDDCDSDGSAIGWSVLAYLDTQGFGGGVTVPPFAKTELKFVIENTKNPRPNGDLTLSYAGSGFGQFDAGDLERTGILLQALSFMGIPLGNADVTNAKNYIGNSWPNGDHPNGRFSGCGFHKGCMYAMFQVFKGLRLYGFVTLPGKVNRPAMPLGMPRVGDVDDWYEDYRDYLVANQFSPGDPNGGHWNLTFSCCGSGVQGVTALVELILAATVTVQPASLTLTPTTATNPIGKSHTVTATAKSAGGGPVQGLNIDFEITSGPNQGKTGTGVSDANGQVKFTYTDTAKVVDGVDTIKASIRGTNLTATALKKWVLGPPDIVVSTGDRTKNGDVLTVELKLRNNGGQEAKNLKITQVTPTLPVTYSGPALPVNKGNLAAGAITTELLSMDLHGVASGATVKFTVRGTYQDTSGKTYYYGSTRYVKVP